MLTTMESVQSESLEDLLYQVIVVKGKYSSNSEIYDNVLQILNQEHQLVRPTSQRKGVIQARNGRSKCYGCCGGCIKWLFKIVIFIFLLVCFTGLIVYLMGLK